MLAANLLPSLRKFSFMLAVALALYIILRITLNSVNFCWEQKRWLPEDEKINLALATVNRATSLVTNPHAYDKTKLDRYGTYPVVGNSISVDDMRKKNPNCCKIERDGRVSVEVTLAYKNNGHIETIPFFDRIGFDNCGELESASSALKW